MIKLGELNIGDTFYIINKNTRREKFGYISSVEKHTVGTITNLKIGKLIKWEDPDYEGFPHGVTIETKNILAQQHMHTIILLYAQIRKW